MIRPAPPYVKSFLHTHKEDCYKPLIWITLLWYNVFSNTSVKRIM